MTGKATQHNGFMFGRYAGFCSAAVAIVCAGLLVQTSQAQFTGPSVKLPSEANQVQVPSVDAALLDSRPFIVHIGAGDVLAVRIFGVLDFVPTVKVSVDGTVQLPLIGLVPVVGLTTEQAASTIAARLVSAGMYKDPQVTVQLTEAVNQYCTITGEIRGIVPLVGQRRLLDVLAAGVSSTGVTTANANIASSVLSSGAGWPASASHVITIVREGEPKPIVVDLGNDPLRASQANIVILPHDLIIVSKVGVVYVVGAFTKQGAIPLDQNTPLTLLQATALSGGTGFEGRFEDLRIIRTQGLERKVVKVDVKRVMRGHDPDPVLQADDIVFLPTNAVKAALKGGGIGTLVGLADVAIIALQR